MKLFLDTNIVIDKLVYRGPCSKEIDKLCMAAYFKDVELWISAQSFADIAYILRQRFSSRVLRDSLLGILDFAHLCSVRPDDMVAALQSDWPDLEDCLIARGAESVDADYLVTRDEEGFAGSRIPSITAGGVLALLAQEGLEYGMVGLE